MSIHKVPTAIQGGTYTDDRGQIRFVNDFDMSEVKRMYITTPAASNPWRAWQGHRREQKWFYCLKGRFEVYTIKPDNWDEPSKNAVITKFELEDQSPNVLHVPSGYINGFRSMEAGSSILVYSDFTVAESKEDDYRFDYDYWDTESTIKINK